MFTVEKRVLKIYDHIENHTGSAADTPSEVCILVGVCMKRPPSSDRHLSLGLWKYWLGFELLYVLASEERVLQKRNRVFCFNVYRAPTQGLEWVLWYKYPQPDDGASSEVDDGVDSDHFQVQLNSAGPFHRTGHHQRSTDWSCLLCTEQEEAGEIFRNSFENCHLRRDHMMCMGFQLMSVFGSISLFCVIHWLLHFFKAFESPAYKGSYCAKKFAIIWIEKDLEHAQKMSLVSWGGHILFSLM